MFTSRRQHSKTSSRLSVWIRWSFSSAIGKVSFNSATYPRRYLIQCPQPLLPARSASTALHRRCHLLLHLIFPSRPPTQELLTGRFSGNTVSEIQVDMSEESADNVEVSAAFASIGEVGATYDRSKSRTTKQIYKIEFHDLQAVEIASKRSVVQFVPMKLAQRVHDRPTSGLVTLSPMLRTSPPPCTPCTRRPAFDSLTCTHRPHHSARSRGTKRRTRT